MSKKNKKTKKKEANKPLGKSWEIGQRTLTVWSIAVPLLTLAVIAFCLLVLGDGNRGYGSK